MASESETKPSAKGQFPHPFTPEERARGNQTRQDRQRAMEAEWNAPMTPDRLGAIYDRLLGREMLRYSMPECDPEPDCPHAPPQLLAVAASRLEMLGQVKPPEPPKADDKEDAIDSVVKAALAEERAKKLVK